MKSSWQLVGEPAGKAQDHGFGEATSPPVPFQLAKRLLREGTFLHPSSHHGFANGLSALHPDPVHGPRNECARRLSSMVDLQSQIQET
jgi:hypothetical protein